MIIGRATVVSHGAAGGAPATALTGVRESSYSYNADVAESMDRDSAFTSKDVALLEGSASITLTWTNHASQVAVLTAMLARTLLAFKFVDEAGYGIYVDCVITSFGRAEPVGDHLTIPIELAWAGAPTGVAPI